MPVTDINEIAAALSKRLADEGRLIEAGWVSLRMLAVPPDAPQVQIDEMRMAFMTGAEHLFASIISILDPGEEPTDADLRRMDLIEKELAAFREEMQLRATRAKGQA
jgi:hypothetical protein